MRSVMQVQAPSPTVLVRFGVFELDFRTGELRKAGARLRLPNQAFIVLAELLERPNELVTREEFRIRLWPTNTFVDFEHGLNAAVRRVREVLGDSAVTPRFIETLPRRGYRFVASVQRVPARCDELTTDAPPPRPGSLARFWSGPWKLCRSWLLLPRAARPAEVVVTGACAMLEREAQGFRPELIARDGLIGESLPMKKVAQFIERVGPARATVLICGETGTGKEMVARAIHCHGPRATKRFVAINCATLSEPLLESTLFGHERGAFTGAVALKRGIFEVANGGTVFLDEVGELSACVQARLLRVIQEREFERVGGTSGIKVDIRLIAATNRDLKRAVVERTFRDDLVLPAERHRAVHAPVERAPGRCRVAGCLLCAETRRPVPTADRRYLSRSAPTARGTRVARQRP